MKALLILCYSVVIGDAYMQTFMNIDKTPPQLQLAQTSSFAIDYSR